MINAQKARELAEQAKSKESEIEDALIEEHFNNEYSKEIEKAATNGLFECIINPHFEHNGKEYSVTDKVSHKLRKLGYKVYNISRTEPRKPLFTGSTILSKSISKTVLRVTWEDDI